MGQHLELADVPQHALATFFVEGGDAVGLDVALTEKAQLLFDGELDRQAVTVVAGFARHVPTLHRLEAGEQIFEDPRLDVMRAGFAIRGRWAFVEDPRSTVSGLFEAALEDLTRLPARQHLMLEGGQVDPCGQRAHPGCSFVGDARRRDEAIRPRGTTLLEALTGLHSGRAVPLRGDLHTGQAPGLAPSPGRSRLRPVLLVPVDAATSSLAARRVGSRRNSPGPPPGAFDPGPSDTQSGC